jgi:hypothetical protein
MALQLKTLLGQWIKNKSGFDKKASSDMDDDTFKFSGAFELIGHLTNSFGRRDWCQATTSPYLALMFGAVNESGILQSIAAKKETSEANFTLTTKVLAQIPVKGETLSAELHEFIKGCLSILQQFYLDFDGLNSVTTDAILNVLQLTYDNFLTIENIKHVDRPYAKEMTQQNALKGAISEDMKMYALDIVFKKK